MFGLATILKLETISKINLDIYISWKVLSQIPVVTLTLNRGLDYHMKWFPFTNMD